MPIALFTLGGTIAMAGSGAGGVVSRLTGADLTAAVPGLAEIPLDVRDVEAVPSAALSYGQILDLVDAAGAALAQGATGVVVTQGTDTLEETAYLADLVWPHPAPLVVTGAMRNPTLAGPDGPANLLAAARVAAAPAARDLGVLVAFNDEIHAARFVRKTHSTSTATFASPNAGPLGHVIEAEIRLLTRPLRHAPLPPVDADRLAATRVALHTITLDDDPALVELLARDRDGLVVAGFGVGHVPPAFAPVLEAIAERMPVVLTSRTGAGSVLRHTYGAVGSETDLRRRGVLWGGLLDPYKAKVLLRLLLAGGAGRAEVAEAFARHG